MVVPAYNPGPELLRALQSVLAQTFYDLQVVVVDDGSSLDLSWVRDVDPRVTLVRQRNAGVSVARNRGVSELTTAWIAFLDQDDEWLPDKVERQLAAVTARPSAPFCSTAFVWCWPDREVRDGHPMTYELLASTGTVCLSSAMVRREAYLRVGGHDPLLTQVGDFALFLNLCLFVGEPAHVDEVLVRYHYHGDNASGDYARAHHERTHVLRKHRARARARGEGSHEAACQAGLDRTDDLFSAQAYQRFREARHRRQYPTAARHLLWSARRDPALLTGLVRRAITLPG